MITLQKQHRTREFRGPAPGSVAIVARKSGHRSADQIINKMKKDSDYRINCEENVKDIEMATIRNEWERNSRQKMILASTFRTFEERKTQFSNEIEKRRNKLRCLLAEENEALSEEVNLNQETVLERQAKLREKARQLKEEKVLDNQMIAQMKYDQMWRDRCEQLRTKMSKKTAIEIAKDNLAIIKAKDDIANDKKYEDEYFEILWNEDIKRKENRELQDAQKAALRNTEMMKTLIEQNSMIKEKRQKEKDLKEEEKLLRLEMLELKKLENDTAYEDKLKSQQKTRDMFDANLRQKMKRINRERQEEIALDVKVMESILAGFEAEANLHHEKKKQLMEDSKRYREYLRRLKEQEIAREKELDEIMNEEIKRTWQKRLDQWDGEAVARKKLLQEVIQIRKIQINDKLKINEENQRQAMIDRENFAKLIESYKTEDRDHQKAIYEKNQNYRNELLEQIKFNRHCNSIKDFEAVNERELMELEENLLQKRIDDALSDEWVDPRIHPWSKMAQS